MVDITQGIPPERLAQSVLPGRLLQLISPEEIILQLFSTEELVDELLFLDWDLDGKERAILKTTILQEICGSETIKEALRRRIRTVLQTLRKISAVGQPQPATQQDTSTESTE